MSTTIWAWAKTQNRHRNNTTEKWGPAISRLSSGRRPSPQASQQHIKSLWPAQGRREGLGRGEHQTKTVHFLHQKKRDQKHALLPEDSSKSFRKQASSDKTLPFKQPVGEGINHYGFCCWQHAGNVQLLCLSPHITIALSSPVKVCWGTVVLNTRQNMQYLSQLKIYMETRPAR